MFGKSFFSMDKKTNKSVSGSVTSAQLTIYDSHYIPANIFTVVNDVPGEWMRWKHESQTAEIKLGEDWVILRPGDLTDIHPLDFGASIDTKGKEDLDEIREQYEKHIASSPWLQRLRDDYNKLLKKHKLFDTIRGDDNAEV